MEMFNKLVRNKIPQIIEQQGEVATVRVLDDDEYKEEYNNRKKSGRFETKSDILVSDKSFFNC